MILPALKRLQSIDMSYTAGHYNKIKIYNEPRREISNNMVCVTSKGSDQPAHKRNLIRAFAIRFNRLLTEHHLKFQSLKEDCTGLFGSTLDKEITCRGSYLDFTTFPDLCQLGELVLFQQVVDFSLICLYALKAYIIANNMDLREPSDQGSEFSGQKCRLIIKTGPQIRVPNRSLFFLFLNQNICCEYAKEPSR